MVFIYVVWSEVLRMERKEIFEVGVNMKVKTFSFGGCSDTVDERVNDFIKDKDVCDIKVFCVCDGYQDLILYLVLYKD